ncbi:hypothetical protein RRG08_019584 [Elysia crispata]|uniref:Uncharacterized protein n=1 Tax=Elysia crispata TaxID=231223 RepID=A0AAE0YKL9_9GAST|nr:hypothetical protein RRG08_019584 [Elysia crispata]
MSQRSVYEQHILAESEQDIPGGKGAQCASCDTNKAVRTVSSMVTCDSSTGGGLLSAPRFTALTSPHSVKVAQFQAVTCHIGESSEKCDSIILGIPLLEKLAVLPSPHSDTRGVLLTLIPLPDLSARPKPWRFDWSGCHQAMGPDMSSYLNTTKDATGTAFLKGSVSKLDQVVSGISIEAAHNKYWLRKITVISWSKTLMNQGRALSLVR